MAPQIKLATASDDDEELVQKIRLLRDAAQQGGKIEKSTGLSCRYLLVKAGLHNHPWSNRVGEYVADPHHFTVRVNNRTTVHIYIWRDQGTLTAETRVDHATM